MKIFIENGVCVRRAIDRFIELVSERGSLAGTRTRRVAALPDQNGGPAGKRTRHGQRRVHAFGEKQAPGAQRPPHAWLEYIY